MENPTTAKLIKDLTANTVDANDLVRGMLQASFGTVLPAEMDAHLGYEHSDRATKAAHGDQVNYRNGS